MTEIKHLEQYPQERRMIYALFDALTQGAAAPELLEYIGNRSGSAHVRRTTIKFLCCRILTLCAERS